VVSPGFRWSAAQMRPNRLHTHLKRSSRRPLSVANAPLHHAQQSITPTRHQLSSHLTLITHSNSARSLTRHPRHLLLPLFRPTSVLHSPSIPSHLHIRICDARLPPRGRREGRAGGAAGQGAEGGPGGLLAGPDCPQPRRVLLRPRRVTRPLRRLGSCSERPGRDREPGAGAGDVPRPGPRDG
jgi:hypothetical protein